ncbi:MAG: tRNA epoxyqueuosine(34) reductase QueG, partial [Planctomycetota bacterium]
MNETLDWLRREVAAEGFSDCGIAPAIDSQGFSNLVQWIDHGFAGEMSYFADRIDAYRHPSGVLPGAQTIIVMTLPYPAMTPVRCEAGFGRVARYTMNSEGDLGRDYHDVIHPKLKRICRAISQRWPDANARGVVDTAPLLEREIAQLAGLGWRGKNTLLLNKTAGSYFLLACVLVDISLPTDESHDGFHCGTCTACLDACPTDAFEQPGVLNASRCINYLTIEHRGMPPESLRHKMGDWWFGCDVCQEVCPWNRRPTRQTTQWSPRRNSNQQSIAQSGMDLIELFSMSPETFRQRFRKTPMWRSKRRGLLRNAAIVLGNQRCTDAIDALIGALNDEEPLVRAACVWALKQMPSEETIAALQQRKSIEHDEMVRNE